MRYKIKTRPTNGGVIMKSLNLSILRTKKTAIMSSTEALKEVTPINWSNDVLTGKKKIIVTCNK